VNIEEITKAVDITNPPPGPSAHILFGTNQETPALIAADRYHQGLAPLIIVTGGINRHNGIIEAHLFRRILLDHGVPDNIIRAEDRSENTWQNVEYALPHLTEALNLGHTVTAVSKWYHHRAVQALRTHLPDTATIYGIGWNPVYNDEPVTRTTWHTNVAGKRRVIREWDEMHF
jgi:uncharacterized SAM-binding protein YcdF (DUF218 family)